MMRKACSTAAALAGLLVVAGAGACSTSNNPGPPLSQGDDSSTDTGSVDSFVPVDSSGGHDGTIDSTASDAVADSTVDAGDGSFVCMTEDGGCCAAFDAGPPDCPTCIGQSCCPDLSTCNGDPNCGSAVYVFGHCLAFGGGPVACEASSMPEASPAAGEFQALMGCAQQDCASSCSWPVTSDGGDGSIGVPEGGGGI
jgi:hypothetical protein